MVGISCVLDFYWGSSMKFELLTKESQVIDLVDFHNKNSAHVVLDTETTSTNIRNCELVEIQMLGKDENTAVMFSAKYLPVLKELDKPLVFWNARFDLAVCKLAGTDLTDKEIIDAMLVLHLIKEDEESYALDFWVQKLYKDNYKELFWGKYKNYTDAPETERLDYGCRDILYTDRIYRRIMDRFKSSGMDRRLISHCGFFLKALLNVDIYGIKVDLNKLVEKSIEVKEAIHQSESKVREFLKNEIELVQAELWEKEISKRKTDAGKSKVPKPEFLLDSSKQLQTLLYDKLNLPVQYNEKTKKPSVDDASLVKLKDEHPAIELIRDYRENVKILGTFLDGTLEKMEENRIYPSFHIHGTATGRTSSSKPNFQQYPRRGGIKEIFIPDEGWVFISCDYSQLEVTLAAHFSKDKQLIRIVTEGISQHDITAEALGIERNLAKTVNFALQYRASHYKLSKILKISEEDAIDVYNKYWETYSGLRDLMKHCDDKVDIGEPIQTPFGRRRRFEKIKRQKWDKAYRQAYNFLIQSTGADMTNKAFYTVDKVLKSANIGKALFPVHDELLITCKKEKAKEAEHILRGVMLEMAKDVDLSVPLKVESSGAMERWED